MTSKCIRYGTLRPAGCGELNVRTVHRRRNFRVNLGITSLPGETRFDYTNLLCGLSKVKMVCFVDYLGFNVFVVCTYFDILSVTDLENCPASSDTRSKFLVPLGKVKQICFSKSVFECLQDILLHVSRDIKNN
jgi:hypothetical protein